MKRGSGVSASELCKEVEKGRRHPFYFLHGEEDYLRDVTAAWLGEILAPDQAPDFNVDIFYGDTLGLEDFLKIYNSYPMMAAHRLVFLKRCEKLSIEICNGLESILDSPSATTLLIFIGGKVDLRRKFFRELAKLGRAVEFRVPYANQLPQWIQTEAKKRGLQIDPEAADFLRLYIGPSLRELAGEIEKLSIFVGSSGEITRSAVEQVVGSSNKVSIFELTDAIGSGNSRKAFELLRSLMEQGEEPSRSFAWICRHIQLLLKTQELMKRAIPKKKMAVNLGISPYFLDSYMNQARRHSANSLWVGLGSLLEADSQLKSRNRRHDPLIADLLVRKLCSVRR